MTSGGCGPAPRANTGDGRDCCVTGRRAVARRSANHEDEEDSKFIEFANRDSGVEGGESVRPGALVPDLGA